MIPSIKPQINIKSKPCQILVSILTSTKTTRVRVYAIVYYKLETCSPLSICFTFPTNVSPTLWRPETISDKNSISLSTQKYIQIARRRLKYPSVLFWLLYFAVKGRGEAGLRKNSKRISYEWVQLDSFQLRRPRRLRYCFLFLSKSYRAS
jgi:hypothetical protein